MSKSCSNLMYKMNPKNIYGNEQLENIYQTIECFIIVSRIMRFNFTFSIFN